MTVGRRHDGSPRVVVTGIGVKSPAGNSLEEAYATVLSGKSQATHLPELMDAGLAVTFGCPVPEFDTGVYFGTVENRHLDRATKLGVAAAADAVADSGQDFRTDPDRSGVYVGTGGVNLASTVTLAGHQHDGDLSRVPVIAVPMIMPNSTAARIAIRYAVQGPCLTVNAACASGATAIGEAMLAIRAGRIDRAVTGGVDALLTPFFMAAFARLGALSRRNQAPAEASRPFDGARDGFVMAEGAAFLVLERLEDADRRGATIYGEISGYAATTDAAHIVKPRDDGAMVARCMRAALGDAGLAPAEVGHVNTHGSSTMVNDRAEAAAIRACFGHPAPPITATKGVTGYLLGAGGAFEAALALLCGRDGLVPPIANFIAARGTPDPDVAGLDIVHAQPRETAPAPALSTSIGFGGHNAALVLTPL
ncbi:MAG: 3-oxoacyl-[acyl-carrier-protein] synthase [Streptosporangiaceae bacterium]|jgi:3-oxoacyl-[acyl-carrier-protein] synthase II|nr:3-oxoacyl-(acyl-carrier-protein) synthase [Streptosporangiaceae bacterium]MDX6432832.1 3-oxoacyl-[acyl-carrier-protein] synthase [Streptosporangiaceae bacterium]